MKIDELDKDKLNVVTVSDSEKRVRIKRYKELYNIHLDFDKLYDTYSPIEWYEFVLSGKVARFPNTISTDENWKTVCKYVINEKLNKKTRDEILTTKREDLSKLGIFIGKRNTPNNLTDFMNYLFPQYHFRNWEFPMLKPSYFDDEDKIIEALDWLFEKHCLDFDKALDICNYMKMSSEDFILENKLSVLLKKFKGYQNMLIWYGSKKDVSISYHDFAIKANGYWLDTENADYMMKAYIKSLFDKGYVNDAKRDLPSFLTNECLANSEHKVLSHCVKKYKHYDNMYDWITKIHPEFGLTPRDLNVHIAKNGQKCNSHEEKIIFDFIYDNLNIKELKAVGVSKNEAFHNVKYGEKYYPDFIINKIGNNRLDKPIIIEYYGLYNIKNYNNSFVGSYIDKAHRKNCYFKSLNDIYFIDLYPKDLRDDFNGVQHKIISLIQSIGMRLEVKDW